MKNVIDRTNTFYLEMSRKVLSEREYDVMQKLLLEKMSLQEAADSYGFTSENIRQIYQRTYKKVKSVTELLAEIDTYKHKLQQLKQDFKKGGHQIKKRENKTEIGLSKKLYDSHFPFSKRMHNIIEVLDVHTVGQLAEIPLERFGYYMGFGQQCKKELIAFIEFENIEHLFKGFSLWKTKLMK